MTDYAAAALDFLRSNHPDTQRRPTPDDLGRAMIDAIRAGELEQKCQPIQHCLNAGVYYRKIFCDPGDVIVTKRHKLDHITIAERGECYVSDESGNQTHVVAPAVWRTKAGTQRAVFCPPLDSQGKPNRVEWATVHQGIPDYVTLDDVEVFLTDSTLTDELKFLEVMQ